MFSQVWNDKCSQANISQYLENDKGFRGALMDFRSGVTIKPIEYLTVRFPLFLAKIVSQAYREETQNLITVHLFFCKDIIHWALSEATPVRYASRREAVCEAYHCASHVAQLFFQIVEKK